MKKFISAAVILVLGAFNVSSGDFAHAQSQYILLSPYYLVPGQNLTVSGFNFPANTNINLGLAGATQSATTDNSGNFNTPAITVPAAATNSIVQVTANGGGEVANTDLSVGGFYPNVKPSSWFVVQGGEINFNGSGFEPGEQITITNNGSTLAKINADNQGDFASQNFPVGFVSGNDSFNFTGANSGASINLNIKVADWNPYITLNNYYAPTGSSIQITGKQFGANEKINISFGGNNIGSINTDSSGSFVFNFSVPTNASDKENIEASGTVTGTNATAIFTTAAN